MEGLAWLAAVLAFAGAALAWHGWGQEGPSWG